MQIVVPLWRRGFAQYIDGWIVLDTMSSIPDWELAMPGRNAPFALAGVRNPNEILSFVEEYGLLRHSAHDGQAREAFVDWQEEVARLNRIMAWHIASLRGAVEGESAAREMAHMINEGRGDLVVRTNIRVDPDAPRGFVWQRVAQAKTLISAIYHELDELIEAERDMRYCDDCKRVFLVGDPRQQYCNVTCANRAAYHRRAARARAAANHVDAGSAGL